MIDPFLLSAQKQAETVLSQCPQLTKSQHDEVEKVLRDFFVTRLSTAHKLAVDAARLLHFDSRLTQELRNSVQKQIQEESFGLDITMPDPGDSASRDLVVVSTSFGSEMFSLSKDSKTPTFGMENAKALRNAIRQWDGRALVPNLEPPQGSPLWASCIMELLYIEIKLFEDLRARNEVQQDYAKKCIRCMRLLYSKYEKLPPSFVLKGVRHEDSEIVDAGGFANIYIGQYRGQKVCVKRFRSFSSSTDAEKQKLIKDSFREALVWKSLQHPNVLPFFGVTLNAFKSDPTFCLVSPWMEKGNLMHYLRLHPDHDRWTAIREIAQALKYLHEHGILHGDIKGANVLVADEYRCMLSDFGLASVAESISTTAWSRPMGSVRWLAPEFLLPASDQQQNTNDMRPTRERDVYAYGCTVLEIFTGEVPFSHCRMDGAVIAELLHKRRPPKPETTPQILWNTIKACWNDEPGQRLTAVQILDRIQSDSVAVTLPPSPVSDSASIGTFSTSQAEQSSQGQRSTETATRRKESRTKRLAKFGFQ